VLPNIGIQCIINVHVVRWGFPGPICLHDTIVGDVVIGSSKVSYVPSGGGRGQIERRQVPNNSSHGISSGSPKIMGKLSSAQTKGVKIGGVGVVAERAASVDDTEATLSARMHGDQIQVVLHQPKCSTDIVIGQVDLISWAGDSEVVKPHHKLHLSSGEGEGWLVVK